MIDCAHGWRFLIASLFCALCVPGCEASGDAALNALRDYRERALTLLEVDVASLPTASASVPVDVLRKRELLVPVAVESVGLLEFFELQQCELGVLVAERSSPLGKLAPLSGRLTYELQFLNLAQRCLAANDGLSDDAKQLVGQIVADKRNSLDRHLWNALFAGPEMLRRLGNAEGNLSELATQLNDLRDLSLQARSTQEGWQQWNGALASLANGGGVGRAVERWRFIEQELGLVVAALEQSGRHVCRNGRSTPRARNLKALLEEFFIVRVRAKLAVDLQRDESWVRSMNALAEDFADIAPPSFRAWRSRTLAGGDSIWQRSQRTLVAHAQAWAALLEACAIPVAPAPPSDHIGVARS